MKILASRFWERRTSEEGGRGTNAPAATSTPVTLGGAAHPPRFQLLTVEEVLALPDPEWLVEGIIPATSMAQLYGKSGLGKTFVALDMALSVAVGTPWLGSYKVRQGPVVYVAAEGLAGMKSRARAWLKHHDHEPAKVIDFRVVGTPVQLVGVNDVEVLTGQVEATFPGRGLQLVVLDTQARCTVGVEENSAKEMGVALEAADRLRRSTGATVLLLHHTGYEGDHARGSTAVYAALDSQVSLSGPRKALNLTCTKQKEWEEFEPIRVALIPVGGSLVSVLDAPDSPARLRIEASTLSEKQEQALDLLRDHPDGLRAGEWQVVAAMARSTFYNARDALLKKGLIQRDGTRYTVVEVQSGSDGPYPESDEAYAPEVHRSTHPLGGGPLDREARAGDSARVQEHVAESWEEAATRPIEPEE